MVAKTPHNNGNNFILKLGSLTKTNVHTFDWMTIQFVSNKQEHPYQENLACGSGIHYQENEIKSTKSTKTTKKSC
jgi:hypothetical protein